MSPIIGELKKDLSTLREKVETGLSEYGKMINALHVKFIEFGNQIYDARVSEFFTPPADEYEDYVTTMAFRGGDISKTAFDSISDAMCSDWPTGTPERRHVIICLTDAPNKGYSDKLVREFITDWNGDMRAKRLIVFSPRDESWSFLEDLVNCYWIPVSPGKGMEGVSFDDILAIICSSI